MTTPGTVDLTQLETVTTLNNTDELIVNNAGSIKKTTIQKIADLLGIASHIADGTIHHVIDDTVTSSTKLWSSQKINAAINAISSQVLALVPVLKGGTGLNAIPVNSILYTPTANTLAPATIGSGLVVNGGVLSVLPGLLLDKRQSVLSGSVDAAGHANFLSAGTGLSVNADATTGLTYSFSAGFGAAGAIEYIGRTSASFGINSLTASSTCFLYADYNLTSGQVTYGFSTLRPSYGNSPPSSPANGQHWFNTTTFRMYQWNGTAFVQVTRVFIGEAVTNSSAVTSVITYAIKGKTVISLASLSGLGGINTPINHNLGTSDVLLSKVELVCNSTEANYPAGNKVIPLKLNVSFIEEGANTASFTFGTTLGPIQDKNAGTDATLSFGNWGANFYISRGF